MNEANPTVLVVDDDESFRRALCRLLQTEALQVEEFASAEAVLARKPLNGVGCILLDLQLSKGSGLALQAKFAAHGVTTPIVFLTGHGDIGSSVAAMKAGAIDFLTKPVQKTDLLAALRQAFARDRAARAAAAMKREALTLFQLLTPRETEVMRLVACGLLNKQVAGELGTSEATIKVHRGRVMQKLRVQSVADMIRLGQAAGVLANGITDAGTLGG